MTEFHYFAGNFHLKASIDIDYIESLPFTPISFPNVFQFKPFEWIGYVSSKNNSYAKFLLLNPIYPEAALEVAQFMQDTTGIEIDIEKLRIMSFYRDVLPHIDTPTNTRLFLSYKNSNACEYYTSNIKNIAEYVRDTDKKQLVNDGELFFFRTDTLHESVQLDYNRKVYWFNYNFGKSIDDLLVSAKSV